MHTTKPHPERFETYTLLPDGKSFMIKGCKFVFKLDRYGGWRDQYGHYYNSKGQPDFQPEDAELTPSQGSIDSDYAADDYDQFEPDYDNDYHQEQQNAEDIRNMERISKNLQILSTYPLGKPLRVYFSNMPFKAPPKSVYQAYSKKVNGIKNIIFELQNNRRNGQGHFIMEDVKKAQDLVRLEGEKVIQREVHFDVEKLNDLIMDPIKESQLNPFWVPQSKNNQIKQQKKDDIPKFKAAPAQKKQQQPIKPLNEPKKPQKKEQPKKPQQKKQQRNRKESEAKLATQKQYKSYTLNFELFANPKQFYKWITQHGFDKQTDIKQVLKQMKNGSIIITLEAKPSMVQVLNGKQYNGKEVKITPI